MSDFVHSMVFVVVYPFQMHPYGDYIESHWQELLFSHR
jgi:hypothetical protein